jgi:hypothetical protein
MNIVINTARLTEFLNASPNDMFSMFFWNVGWIIVAAAFVYGTLQVYLFYIQGKWAAKQPPKILLAIDIPKGNEQSPKAVENLFTYLGGAHGSINFFEKWFEGRFQQSFSFEIVSIDGYTQFLIRTPNDFKNLVETAIYSQYPDAEITEVDDYTTGLPRRFPDEEWDIQGSEFILAKPYPYPIKLYKEFEHQFGPSETQFKDPMASLMDLCSSLQEGEQLWFQIIVVPTDFSWIAGCDAEVDNILGKAKKTDSGLAMKFIVWLGEVSESIFSIWGDIKPKEEKKALSMMELTPKQKKQVEAIHEKASKLGFEAKLRFVYIAKKDVMNKSKVFSGFVGWIKQFTSMDLNNIKPDTNFTMTKTTYFNRDSRLAVKKNNLMINYVNRDAWSGRARNLYNIEELATLWHFPIEANVKGSFIQKTAGHKANAPESLPIWNEQAETGPKDDIFKNFKTSVKNEAPSTVDKIDPSGLADSFNDSDIFWTEETPLVAPKINPAATKSAPPSNLPFA